MIGRTKLTMGLKAKRKIDLRRPPLLRGVRLPAALASIVALLLIVAVSVLSQGIMSMTPNGTFRVGERLTYSVSLENLKNIAFLETSVLSTGRLGGKDVVEIRGKLKTFELVSAAFNLVDETRTVYADPATGLPLYVSRKMNEGAVPREIASNFLASPNSNFELLSVIYKIRESGGVGSFPLLENGENSLVTATSANGEKIKTFAGEFDTSAVTLTGPYFDARGIKKFTVNLSADERKLPVLIRFKTEKGEYRAELTNIQDPPPVSDTAPTPSPTPIASLTPKPKATPKTQPTEPPYVPNQPLLPELSFVLGETLEYHVTNMGTPVATVRLSAKERTQFRKRDSLTLTATVTAAEPGNGTFALGDSITTRADPDLLVPIQNEMKFSAGLATLSQSATFDPVSGLISFAGVNPTDAPIGTHTFLSLLYAMRSFNLRPSKNLSNPVNDTRVAVFWSDRAYIFTLRPSNSTTMLINGEPVEAQLITVITGNRELDQLALKVWLSTDERRVPVRISVGKFQAELTATSIITPD